VWGSGLYNKGEYGALFLHVLGSKTYHQAQKHRYFRAGGSVVFSCTSFFTFFTWLVAPVFVDLEGALVLTGYGTPLVSFGVPQSSFFRIISHHWGLWMSTIRHLAQSSLVIGFHMLDHTCIPGMKPTSSWHVTFLMFC
jgi:hypothetical protein